MKINIPFLKTITKDPSKVEKMEELKALGELIEEKGHEVALRYKLGTCRGGNFILLVTVKKERPFIFAVEKRDNNFLCDHLIPGIPVSFIKDSEYRFKICV
ncbi:MAG: hypothetical protein UT05_C0001G0096 [Parcubacteria group bacterium GW2011_GWF2_38_76]|nr:MAG: hypothetical protein UT05_C0001G0096 [Parcubacteria group bacterium GW2011_GWF2_38_76]HBM45928.1 hypothetical protein [Patescibacteria group bacterium]